MDSLKYWLWLSSIEDIGSVRAKSLLSVFKDPEKILKASLKQLQKIDGIGELIAERIVSSKVGFDFEEELIKFERNNISVITQNSENYPILLKNIYAAPILLYCKGNLLENENTVAIVGSRNATQYGIRAAYELSKHLAKRGITIVSGLARGIDTAAHKGALEAGGRTIAVLGSGLDVIYPPENAELMKKISENGAVVSEYPLGTIPDARNFPARNRIISGLSLGTIVVEATRKSGSLITAEFALDQNREVFAVPGNISSKESLGTNNLIKQGAKIVCSAEDIIEELNLRLVERPKNENETVKSNVLNLNDDELSIYSNILDEPMHLENLMKNSSLGIARINTVITLLELKGLIKQLPGKLFVRN